MKDGGPAFPKAGHEVAGSLNWGNDGMSLRDYIAVHALGMIKTDDVNRQVEKHSVRPEVVIANLAYVIANAMIAEREKK